MCTLKPQMVENLFYGFSCVHASLTVDTFAQPDGRHIHNRSTNLPEDVISLRLKGKF